jgi:hypothetical protein
MRVTAARTWLEPLSTAPAPRRPYRAVLLGGLVSLALVARALTGAGAQTPAVPGPASTLVIGTVLQVNAATAPQQVTVQVGTAIYTYSVAPGASIVRTDAATGSGGPVALTSLSPGDLVQIVTDQNGTAQAIRATYAEVSGVVAAVTPNTIVLQDGNAYRLHPAAPGTQSGAGAAGVGDIVTLRLNPQTTEVWAVTVRQRASVTTVTSVAVTPADRQLTTGDVLTVTANGPAGGTASFSIAGLRSGLPMIEQAGSPGTYIGTYTVQAGDHVSNAHVTVQVVTPSGQAVTATSQATVSIDAAATSLQPYRP